MADCFACEEYLHDPPGDPVYHYCRSRNNGGGHADDLSGGLHKAHAERLARELIREGPSYLELYDHESDRFYFCRSKLPRNNNDLCLRSALIDYGRLDISNAICQGETDSAAAVAALESILQTLYTPEAQRQLHRVIATLRPPEPRVKREPRPREEPKPKPTPQSSAKPVPDSPPQEKAKTPWAERDAGILFGCLVVIIGLMLVAGILYLFTWAGW